MSLVSAAKKRVIYVGGLDEQVDETVLRNAFITFGEIIDVNLPLDYATQQHKGFAFIEFEESEDALAAIDNMSESEIYGNLLCIH